MKNTKVLLTGANGGIGAELKKLLLAEGADLTCVASSQKNEKDVVIDLSNHDDLEKLKELITGEKFDIIINMAGINNFTSVIEQDDEEILKTININLIAPMIISKHALKTYMVKENKGHIVNVGSVLGAIPMPYYATYAASKAGLKAFSESTHRELSDSNVNISYIAPRAVETKINSDIAMEFMQQTGTNIDKPEDVAAKIMKVLKQPKPRTTIGCPESFFSKLNAVAPCLVDNDMAKKAKIAKELLNK